MTRDRDHKSWRDIDRAKDHPSRARHDHSPRRRSRSAASSEEARRARSALEALFAPKKETPSRPAPTTPNRGTRIVLPPPPTNSPEREKRQKLLGRLLEAASPLRITKAANDYLAAGFDFPEDQLVYLQLLDHEDEKIVRQAMDGLLKLLAGEQPKRKPLMEQRLRRLEEQAEEASTRDAATNLRRVLHGRGKLATRGGHS